VPGRLAHAASGCARRAGPDTPRADRSHAACPARRDVNERRPVRDRRCCGPVRCRCDRHRGCCDRRAPLRPCVRRRHALHHDRSSHRDSSSRDRSSHCDSSSHDRSSHRDSSSHWTDRDHRPTCRAWSTARLSRYARHCGCCDRRVPLPRCCRPPRARRRDRSSHWSGCDHRPTSHACPCHRVPTTSCHASSSCRGSNSVHPSSSLRAHPRSCPGRPWSCRASTSGRRPNVHRRCCVRPARPQPYGPRRHERRRVRPCHDGCRRRRDLRERRLSPLPSWAPSTRRPRRPCPLRRCGSKRYPCWPRPSAARTRDRPCCL